MWYRNENGSVVKPAEIDNTSSELYVYVRKDFEEVAETEENPAHWTWMETKVRKEDWETYAKVMGHDSALDDVYAALTELAEIIAGED